MAAFGGLVRNSIVALAALAMGMLILLAIRSLARSSPGTGTADGETPATGDAVAGPTVGPTTTIAFQSGSSTGSVGCARLATDAEGPFYLQLIDPAGAETLEKLAVGVALIEPDGSRQDRIIEVDPAAASLPVQVVVAESVDPNQFVDCTVTAIQRDHQVILTGK